MAEEVESIRERSNCPLFFQAPPELGNQFVDDSALVAWLSRLLPPAAFQTIHADLTQFGNQVAGELLTKAAEIEAHPPIAVHFDAFGKRIDHIVTSEAWKSMKGVSAKEGLVALGYDRRLGEHSRLYQFTKLCLFAPSSGLYSCPLAMTDGAARLCEVLLNNRTKNAAPLTGRVRAEVQDAFEHLTSRDPKTFWTSGQWMTERGGGSDVGFGTRTIARPQADGSYRLWGFKWFTSATDADVAITLARVEHSGRVQTGSQGLSCFLVKVRNEKGELNNIKMARLKEKLGTKQLPTSELELNGTFATLLSLEGRGVALISELVNITRLHNAASAVGGMRRMVALQRDYSGRRQVFGRLLADTPSHLSTLCEMEVQYRGALAITLECLRLLGKVEIQASSKQDAALLRLLIPLTKLYTAKQAVAVASEGLESFGGLGYCEDTGLPRLLRDAQVLPIWEGTTNVLSHDVLRVLGQSTESLAAFIDVVKGRVAQVSGPNSLLADMVGAALGQVIDFIKTAPRQLHDARSRDLALSMSRVYIASCLLEHALWSGQEEDWVVASHWIRFSAPLVCPGLHADSAKLVRSVALDGCRPSTGPRYVIPIARL